MIETVKTYEDFKKKNKKRAEEREENKEKPSDKKKKSDSEFSKLEIVGILAVLWWLLSII